MFPDLGYVIVLASIATIVLPILLLIVMKRILHRNKAKTIYHACCNFSFIILFFWVQKNINANRSKYLIPVLETESLIAAGLLIFLVWKFSKKG